MATSSSARCGVHGNLVLRKKLCEAVVARVNDNQPSDLSTCAILSACACSYWTGLVRQLVLCRSASSFRHSLHSPPVPPDPTRQLNKSINKMTRFTDLDDNSLGIMLRFLDLETVRNVRHVNSRFNEVCADVIFARLNRTIAEVPDIQNWVEKLHTAPWPVKYTTSLAILNQPRPRADINNYHKTIPALSAMEARSNVDQHGENQDDYTFALGPLRVERHLNLNDYLMQGFLGYNIHRSIGELPKGKLNQLIWRHALPMPIVTFIRLVQRHHASLRSIEVTEFGPFANIGAILAFRALLDMLPQYRGIQRLSIRSVDNWGTAPSLIATHDYDRLWAIREIFQRLRDGVLHLRISNEHFASQYFEHVPRVVPLQFDHLLFDPDINAIDPELSVQRQAHTLSLESLELGWFDVRYICAPIVTLVESEILLRLNVPRLRRLVLEDCTNVIEALKHLKIQGDQGNLRLTQFALRHTFPPAAGSSSDADPNYNLAFDYALKEFLASFQGLELLSLLLREGVDGLYQIEYDDRVWQNHQATLKCMVSDFHHSFEFIHAPTPTQSGPYHTADGLTTWTGGRYLTHVDRFGPSNIEEIGFTLNQFDTPPVDDRYLLRLFSQFTELRVAHIRNNSLSDRDWRDEDGSVTNNNILTATAYANRIGLPYYADPRFLTVVDDRFKLAVFQQADDDVAAFHRRNRTTRGLNRPPKPKLQLLVIGEWGYRDQMNLAGPRLSPDGYMTQDGEWNEEEPLNAAWTRRLLPVFFEVEWEWTDRAVGARAQKIERTEQQHQRAAGVEFPGWRARVRAMEQVTVEGWPELPGGKVKILDFAWQD